MKRAPVLLGLLLLAGCFGGTPVAEVPEHVPAFPGYPSITAYAGDPANCKKVLAIGDSLMHSTQPFLAGVLSDSGRCVTVIKAAVGGTGPVGTGGGVDWRPRLAALLTQHQPDIVVMEFVGNSVDGHVYGSPAWATAQNQATLQLINQAKTAGASVYVMAAPSAAWFCWFDHYGPPWNAYRTFVRSIANVGHGDWSTYLTPGDIYARQMNFSGRVAAVRTDDCLHLTDRGSRIAAHVTAAAIQREWL